MKIHLLIIIVFVFALSGHGKETDLFFAQAKKSLLYRPLAPNDYTLGWKRLSSQDVNISKWNTTDFRKYIQCRASDIDDVISKTKAFEYNELKNLKGDTQSKLISTAKIYDKSRKYFWKEITPYPTVLDFVAASNLIETTGNRSEAEHLRLTFETILTFYVSYDEDQREAYFLFAELCQRGVTSPGTTPIRQQKSRSTPNAATTK